jgi:hypothetical protein
VTFGELVVEARRLSDKIDEGVRALTSSARDSAEAEHTYRLARARAWTVIAGTAQERLDGVNAATADERRTRDLAEAGRQAALEALRSRRQQLSAVQSIAAAWRAEAEHAKYGPEVRP